MKDKSKFLKIIKYVGVLLLMYICAPVGLICYGAGATIDIMIVILAVVFAYVGYIATHKILELLFLYANLLLSVYIGSSFSTKLYYERVSSDDMTLIVGRVFMYIALAVTVLAVLIFAMVRVVKNKRGEIQNIDTDDGSVC